MWYSRSQCLINPKSNQGGQKFSGYIGQYFNALAEKFSHRIKIFRQTKIFLTGPATKNNTVTLTQEGHHIFVVDPRANSTTEKVNNRSPHLDLSPFDLCTRPGHSKLNHKGETHGSQGPQFLMIQLSRDLGGNHWLQYDKDYQEWVATKT